MRCHFLVDSTVNFAFTIRRAEYFIPAGVLLKCFLDVSDRELFAQLLALAPQVCYRTVVHWRSLIRLFRDARGLWRPCLGCPCLRSRRSVPILVCTQPQVGDPKEDKASVQFLAERAELLLRVANSHGLRSRQQALEWLGSHFRVALMAPQHMSDMQASSQQHSRTQSGVCHDH